MFGFCLGLVAHSLGFNRPHGKLFQILIGLPLAIAAAPLIWRGFISRNWACLCVAVGAIAGFVHQHLLEYREFPQRYAVRLHAVLEGEALASIVKEVEADSSRIDSMAASGGQLSEEHRQRIAQAQQARDKAEKVIAEMKATADYFAGQGKNAELAPLLAMRRDEWRRIRKVYEKGGVQRLGLEDPADEVSDGSEALKASRRELDVLRSVGFREYLAARTEQGETFKIFGKTRRLGPTATILWWLLEMALAAGLACLLVRRVHESKDFREALGSPMP